MELDQRESQAEESPVYGENESQVSHFVGLLALWAICESTESVGSTRVWSREKQIEGLCTYSGTVSWWLAEHM